MQHRTIISEPRTDPRDAPHDWLLDALCVLVVVFIPNLMMGLQVKPLPLDSHAADRIQHILDSYEAMGSSFYVAWLATNLALLGLLLILRSHLLQPLQRIMQQLQRLRLAYQQDVPTAATSAMTVRLMATEVMRFTNFALEYFQKHKELSQQLEHARRIIAQFTLHQNAIITHTGREIGTQYRSVLAYANYLEEQIANNKLDPSLRYDFDDICESSFNLKLIAGALAMLSTQTPHITTVPLASLMQQTMLALAPALDRRSMKLTTAEVDVAVAGRGDCDFVAHILWMMLLGMIRYAADESTLRIRCLHNREGTQAILSIVVSELSPLQLSVSERSDHLVRQLQHLTPHMFAETIRIHGNVQLANLLIERMGGHISILPLTVSSCEICMVLPTAEPPAAS
jgi:hypothetical protein